MAGIKVSVIKQRIRVQEERYKGVREELLAAVQGRNLDRLNRALENFIATKLQDKGEIEKAKTVLWALCKEGTKIKC